MNENNVRGRGQPHLRAGFPAIAGRNIGGDQDVSGRVSVELRSTAQRLSSRLNISGTLKGILLRP